MVFLHSGPHLFTELSSFLEENLKYSRIAPGLLVKAYKERENIHLYGNNDGGYTQITCKNHNKPGGCHDRNCPYPHGCPCLPELKTNHKISSCREFKITIGNGGGRGGAPRGGGRGRPAPVGNPSAGGGPSKSRRQRQRDRQRANKQQNNNNASKANSTPAADTPKSNV